MIVASHTQPRDFVATTSHNYNTHDINNCSSFTEDAGWLKRCVDMQRSSVETKRFSGRILVNSGRVWKVHRTTEVTDL
jgi:hypothetical protein